MNMNEHMITMSTLYDYNEPDYMTFHHVTSDYDSAWLFYAAMTIIPH